MFPCESAAMPSGWAAPAGSVAKRVAGVRNHACAGGARNTTTSRAASSARLTSLIVETSWGDRVMIRPGTVSRRPRPRPAVAEDAGRAKSGDALGAEVGEHLRAERPRAELRDGEDAKTGERWSAHARRRARSARSAA